jgi:hypothetical protein
MILKKKKERKPKRKKRPASFWERKKIRFTFGKKEKEKKTEKKKGNPRWGTQIARARQDG